MPAGIADVNSALSDDDLDNVAGGSWLGNGKEQGAPSVGM